MMVARVTSLEPGEFIHTLGDAHIYLNHIDQVKEQLSRNPYPLPVMKIKRTPPTIFDFNYDDFTLEGYNAHPHIKGAIAV